MYCISPVLFCVVVVWWLRDIYGPGLREWPVQMWNRSSSSFQVGILWYRCWFFFFLKDHYNLVVAIWLNMLSVLAEPWNMFVSDAVYTERYMHRPEENSDSYNVRAHISHMICISKKWSTQDFYRYYQTNILLFLFILSCPVFTEFHSNWQSTEF